MTDHHYTLPAEWEPQAGVQLTWPHEDTDWQPYLKEITQTFVEIAQAVAAQGKPMVHYWMHNNMLTINGQKMGKSLGNFITLNQFFTGDHPALTKAFGPMTIRFFILSAHYRGTVDFSNEALEASEKGLERLLNGISDLARVKAEEKTDDETARFIQALPQKCYDAMNDDMATPQVISHLFEACTVVNKLTDHKASATQQDIDTLYSTKAPKFVEKTIRLIPYYTWANRGENQMRVWLPVK